jgi:hypothetical protein
MLDFNEFTQLLKGFEGEKLRQAFNHVSRNVLASLLVLCAVFNEICAAQTR